MASDSASSATAASGNDRVRWIPIESNPDLMTKYSKELGATNGKWVDVFGFDDIELDHIPQPVLAVIFLHTTNKEYDTTVKDEDDKIKQNGQIIDPKLYFMTQTIGGACGGIAIMHSLANNMSELLAAGPLKTFLEQTNSLPPYQRGKALETAKEIASLHERVACDGQTSTPKLGEKVGNHFVTFVHKSGHLYELEGVRPFPINHGSTTPETFLKDTVKICKKRLDFIMNSGSASGTDTDEYRFSVVALTTGCLD